MSSDSGPHIPEEPGSSRDITIKQQRDANERLVLGALRAAEDMDDAIASQRVAQEETSDLRVREGELLATAEFRERLIGIVSHDLRTPLNTIVMASGLLIAHGDLNERDARLVNRTLNSGRRMVRIIAELVEFTRARLGGGFELALLPSDLGEICQDVADELRTVSLVEIYQTNDGSLDGSWDSDRLAQAISNIVGNAVDHAERGSAVQIHVRGDQDSVVASISNKGPCIPPEILPEIFTAFHRGAGKDDKSGEHLGLGLYIAAEVFRAHGGNVTVHSSDNTTTFVVRLPRVAPSR